MSVSKRRPAANPISLPLRIASLANCSASGGLAARDAASSATVPRSASGATCLLIKPISLASSVVAIGAGLQPLAIVLDARMQLVDDGLNLGVQQHVLRP